MDGAISSVSLCKQKIRRSSSIFSPKYVMKLAVFQKLNKILKLIEPCFVFKQNNSSTHILKMLKKSKYYF